MCGNVAWHIPCTIVCTNGSHDLLDLGIAGACADDVGQLCRSCTSKCSYMGVAYGVNDDEVMLNVLRCQLTY